MATFQIDWVNNGAPFEVSPDSLTLGVIEQAQIARKHVLTNLNGEMENVPTFAEDLYRQELISEMDMAENRALILGFLRSVDPTLQNESDEVILSKLGASTIGDLGRAMTQAAEAAESTAEETELRPSP